MDPSWWALCLVDNLAKGESSAVISFIRVGKMEIWVHWP